MHNINIEMKILDENFGRIGVWKFNGKDAGKYLDLVAKKYGLKFKIKNIKEDSDLDWIK